MTAKPNSHPYKITQLPEGFSKLAIAAWKVLDDRELFEIDARWFSPTTSRAT